MAPKGLDWDGAVQVALRGMDALGVTRSLRAVTGQAMRVFLDRLPPELARKIGTDNPVRIYELTVNR